VDSYTAKVLVVANLDTHLPSALQLLYDVKDYHNWVPFCTKSSQSGTELADQLDCKL